MSWWEGQAYHQCSIVARWTHSYEGSLLRVPGSGPRREYNSRAESQHRESQTPDPWASPPCKAPGSKPALPGLTSLCFLSWESPVQAGSGNKGQHFSFWPYHGSLAPLCLINSLILPNSSPLVKKSTLAQRAVCSVLGCGKLFDYAMSLRQHSGQVLQVLCATVKALDLLPASCQSRKMGCLSLGFPPLSGSFLWDVSYPAHPRPNLNSCNLSSQPL